MAYKDVVLADAPIGYWALDSAAALNEVGGTNSTLVGTPTVISTGKGIGSAWSVNQNVAINLTGNYQDFTSDNTFSVEAWFKRSASSAPSYPTLWRRDGNGRTALIRMRDSNFTPDNTGPGRLEVYISNGTTSVNFYTAARYDDDQWHHVVLVVSATGTTGAKLYVDGVNTNTFNNPGNLSYLSSGGSSALAAGGPDPSNGEGWNGGISDIALYGTALTSTRVTAHYTAGIAAVSTNVSVSAPAAVVNITAPAPVAKVVDVWHQTFTATADDDYYTTGGGTATTLQILGDSAPQSIYFNFPDPRLTSTKINSLIFRFAVSNIVGTPTVTVGRVNSAWTEGGTGSAPSSSDLSTGVTKTLSGGIYTVTLTGAALNTWNTGGGWYGIRLRLSGTSTAYTFATRENATVANRPTMEYQLVADLGTPVNAVVTGSMALTVNSPAVTVTAAKNRTVQAPTLVANVSAPAPVVSVGRLARISATPMNLSVDFRGGVARNPDYRAQAAPFEMWIFSPNAKQYVSVPSINQAPAMTVTISGTSDTSISLRTERRVFVNNAASMTIKMVGIYQRENDRYLNYIPSTADMDDVWLAMDENGGTVATDSIYGFDGVTIYQNNAKYHGNPTFGVEGPQLRKAVSFDGVDDFVEMATLGYPTFSDSDLTLEFSLRTSQKNGAITTSNGRWITQTTGVVGGTATEAGLKLVNGELVINMGGTIPVYKTGKFIADGNWHHIVVSVPNSRGVFDFNVSQSRPQFVMIDGVIEWQRYSYTSALMAMALFPDLLMAQRAVNWTGVPGAVPVTKNNLKGDMRDFVLRMNYAVSPNTARKLYYEWAEAMLVTPEPMVLDLTMKDPFKARGNVKKMLVLYGLPYKLFRQQRDAGYYRDGWGNYFSVFAGYYVPTNFGESAGPTGSMIDFMQAMYGRTMIHSNMTPLVFLQPKPFTMEGYMCYPVAVATIPGSTGPLDAPGIVKDGLRDPFTAQLLDEKTGLNRFLDVNKDLNEDVTSFDAITAMNYPAVQPIENNVSANYTEDFEQTNLGLNADEWTQARDRLRDSILDAAYKGVNLWITEPHMAEHLGFIKGWDKHETGARYEFFGPGNIDPTGFTNKRAEYLDSIKMVNGGGLVADIQVGQFNPTWQANAKRQIVNLEPGLTDLAGFEFGDRLHWKSVNAWTPHEDVYAYEVLDRMTGMRVGDQYGMNMWEQADYDGNYPAFDNYSVGVPRKYIVSARPEGIVGKVISKEQDHFYVAYGEQRLNRFRNNAYTIIAERGSVVKGRPIAGRAFIEFMDTEINAVKIPVDRVRDIMNGEKVQPGRPLSTWDFDSRRYKQIVIVWVLDKVITRNGGTTLLNVKDEERYVDLQDADLIYKPFISMNARGLKWLQKGSTLNAGDTKIYTSAMQINLSAGENVKIQRTLNNNITVVEAMRLDLELRQPRNYRGNDVRERTLPMRLGIEMRGIGKSVKAEPMVVNITTPDPRISGSGDFIYVYMDAERNVTLYIKED